MKPKLTTVGKPVAPEAPKQPPKQAKRADWEAVERDYRAGKLTLREIAAKHGCTNGRIVQVAKQRGWHRGDLKKVVSEATQTALIAQELSNEISRVKQGLSVEVAAAVDINLRIINGHRTRMTKATDVVMRMLDELDATTTKTDELEGLFAKAAEEMSGLQLIAFRQRINDLLRLHSRVGSSQKLMAALKDAQVLEAQTFGLYDGKKAKGDDEDLSDEELEERIQAGLKKLGR